MVPALWAWSLSSIGKSSLPVLGAVGNGLFMFRRADFLAGSACEYGRGSA